MATRQRANHDQTAMCPRARCAVGLFALATAFVVAMTSVGWGSEHGPDVELEPLRVVATDEAEAFRLVSDAIRDPFLFLPGVQINRQGAPHSQTDLHIRGSSFSGAGLAVGGLALRHPQTEHFHAELPFHPGLFAPPARQTGLEQVRLTTGHLAGSVGLNFAPVRSRVLADARWGERGENAQSLLAQTYRPTETVPFGLSVFGTRESVRGVDFPDNHLFRSGAGGHAQYRRGESQFDLAAAMQEKTFGARGYYGVSPAWPAEESLDDTLVLGAWRHGDAERTAWRATALWRETADDYRLVLPGNALFRNRHRTRMAAGMLECDANLGENLRLLLRLNAESDDLTSTNLGDHRRERADLLAMPTLSLGKTAVSAGMRAHVFSEYDPAWLPAVGMETAVTERDRLAVSYVETVREPSYTELNYESPGSLGQQGLKRETMQAADIGWRAERDRWQWQAAVFGHRSRHAVDWMKATEDEPRWTATDLGTVDTLGAELFARYAWQRWRLGGGYTGLRKWHDRDVYAARYVLDWPRHTVQAEATAHLTDRLVWSYRETWRRQEPIEARDRRERRSGFLGSMVLRYTPARPDNVMLSLACDNLWDSAFETFVGQPPAGRRLTLSLGAVF